MKRTAWIFCVIVFLSGGFTLQAQTACAPGAMSQVYIRLNQVGYLPQENKVGFVLANKELNGQSFTIFQNGSGEIRYMGMVTNDRGSYGAFAHLYALDFSPLQQPGRYRLQIGGDQSHCFEIGEGIYAPVLPTSLQFFRVQRSGDNDPLLHEPSHLNDGIARGGTLNGQPVDATGGWYDAGDYLKFASTHGYTLDLMLVAYQRHPQVFVDGNTLPSVLAESQIGLDWLLKMWDAEHQILYYQVGDESDHLVGWRMPEDDDVNFPTRPVWACDPGKGANVAGKAAAALALAAVIWGDQTAAFHDPNQAAIYLTAAQELYAYGKANPQPQSATSGFYDEDNADDEMALAAAELYRATSDPAYLADARAYAEAAGVNYALYWGDVHALAHYEIARLDPTYTQTAAALLGQELSSYQRLYENHPFGAAMEFFYWGSAEVMAGAALTALWYNDLTGDSTYTALAQAQRDFLFGVNPWGVSFVNSVGTIWPHYPHHQVANLTGSELVGFWDEGPVTAATFDEQGITLEREDIFAPFQTEDAVYHDDSADYVTNEPTISMNATGIALTAWYVD